mmetsp:Transcript_3390/g.6696  ORF Transcript_3390/g.6696 Transcript_3390/m.6696 type:complete len:251 (+) Transcript_3390:3728-4480(+)
MHGCVEHAFQLIQGEVQLQERFEERRVLWFDPLMQQQHVPHEQVLIRVGDRHRRYTRATQAGIRVRRHGRTRDAQKREVVLRVAAHNARHQQVHHRLAEHKPAQVQQGLACVVAVEHLLEQLHEDVDQPERHSRARRRAVQHLLLRLRGSPPSSLADHEELEDQFLHQHAHERRGLSHLREGGLSVRALARAGVQLAEILSVLDDLLDQPGPELVHRPGQVRELDDAQEFHEPVFRVSGLMLELLVGHAV